MDRYVRAIRRRLAARWLVAGLLAAAFAALGLVLAWLAGAVGSGDRAFPLGRLVARVSGVVLGVGIVVGLVRLALRSSRGVIRRLRRLDVVLAEDLRSGLELRALGSGSRLERAFVDCHGESVAERLLRVPPRDLVSFARLRQSAWLLVLGSVLTGLAVATLPRAAPRLLAVLGAEGGPDRLPRVVPGPGVRNVRLVIHPPRYTGLSLEVVEPDKAPVSVPTGSMVTVVAKTPEPVVWARALIPGGRLVAATLLGERIFRVELVARRPGTVIFSYRTVRGVLHVGETGPRLVLRPDLPPDLSAQPADEQIDLPRPRVLPLRYEITDDYGLLEARLVWKTDLGDTGALLLGQGPRFGAKRKRRIAGVLQWDLTRLGLRSGQTVRFHLEARDNRTGGTTGTAAHGAAGGGDRPGSQQRRTRTQIVTITGPRRAELRIIARLRALLERSVRRLADRLDPDQTRPCGQRIAAQNRARGPEVRLVKDVTGLIAEVRKKSPVPALLRVAVTGPLAMALGGLRVALAADRRAAAGKAARKAAGGAATCSKDHPLQISHRRVVAGLEALVLSLDRLIGRATLEQMQRLGERITRLQQEIDKLEAALKKNPSAQVRRRIARRVVQLRRLFERLGHLWSTLQDDELDQHVNRYALDRRRTGKLLDRLAKGASQGRVSGADLDQLRRRVNRLKEALDQGLDRFRRFHPLPGERGLRRDTLAIRRLADAQEKLNRQRGRNQGGARRDQRRLSDAAARLGRSLRGRPGREGVARLVRDAAQLMRQAAEAHGRAAGDKGKAAKDALDKAARDLERQGRLTKGRGEDGQGGGRRGDVDIPPAGGALPRSLRQRILEGGRTAWPEGFRRPLKRYYERLLR